jgi:hypothetical protein
MKKLLFLPIALLVLLSCKKNASDSNQSLPEPATSDALYKRLLQLGFKEENIQVLDKYYLVDGDLLFDKKNTDMKFFESYFEKLVNNGTGDPAARHWVTPDLVSAYNIENIKMPTDEFVFNGEISDWRRSSMQAMNYWAGITNCNINFIRYYTSFSGPRYINIIDDGGALPNNTIAAAEFPSSGNPGFQIRVNLDFNSNVNVPAGQREYNLVHELGHCFGFRHTNWQLRGEPQLGAIAVSATSASQDPNSVMNGGTANNSWTGFSTDDVNAARAIYPTGTYTNWITAPNSGAYPGYSHYYFLDYSDPVAITWNAGLVSTSTVTLQVFQNGNFVQTIAAGIPNSGSYNYPVMNVVGGGAHQIHEIQIKIISDANPSITDFSSMFDIYVD